MNRPDDFLRRRPRGAVGWILFLVVAAAFFYLEKRPGRPGAAPSQSSRSVSNPQTGDSDFAALARDRRERVAVSGGGTVIKTLPDDTEGDRHQRFLIRLDGATGGGSILVAHNIDLAERVPVREGDAIRFAGEYAWNDRGGVVHWTHRDPAHKHPDGYIERNGRRYQ